jgi:hypothetical protein
LPFNALVTDPAGPRWLSEKFQMVMLPSPLSLGPPLGQKAMNADGNRQFPFVGFGSPLLRKAGSPSLGKPNDCAEGLGFPRPNRGLADVDALRRLCELTDEEDMLFWLAKAFNVDKDSSLSLWVGPRASVTNIKNMASNIFLKDVTVLAFATHGLNATDVLAASGTEEPGLVLTPPAKATSSDDGLLSASEISKLDISADLVLLIACDSALGDRLNTEALTGLTRAFFSAGAKKILVSQFPVDVVATRSLMKSFAESISSSSFDPDMAIHQAMKEMREGRDAVYAHPRYWAGFMLVMSRR